MSTEDIDDNSVLVKLDNSDLEPSEALVRSCRKLSDEIFQELDKVTLKLKEIKTGCGELRSKLDDSFGKSSTAN